MAGNMAWMALEVQGDAEKKYWGNPKAVFSDECSFRRTDIDVQERKKTVSLDKLR